MRQYTFLYKNNNDDDRDCVKYVELERLGKLECGHYFPSIGTDGACFSGSLKLSEIDFDNVTTILTKEEFEALDIFNKAIYDLKYGIKKGDERYVKGIELYNGIEPIIEKLLSEENEELFLQLQKEESEFLQDKYSLSEDEVQEIFDNYYLDYRDRGIISSIFDNAEEAGKEYLDSTGDVPEHLENYIDYEKFGEDLLEREEYFQLEDGRVVRLNY